MEDKQNKFFSGFPDLVIRLVGSGNHGKFSSVFGVCLRQGSISVKKMILAPVLTVVFFCQLHSQSLFDSLWNDPQIERRITDGIERNRKGDATVIIRSKDGRPLKNVTVEVRQLTHEFLFGSNIFMFGGFEKSEDNQKYESLFGDLFNYASIPFYWKDFEPEPGKPRFEANSPVIYRRPPSEPIVTFCRKKGITMKGHTLVWDHPRWSIPTYWPADSLRMRSMTEQRIRQLADRYRSDIRYWDVVNEVLSRHMDIPMPYDFALDAFRYSGRAFNSNNILLINETTNVFNTFIGEYSPYYLLIESLKAKGARIDAIGLQFHFFSEALHYNVLAGKSYQPGFIFDVLDQYARLKLPLHITEITFPALPAGPEGERNQARLTRNFYRLWFSHPSIEAITWWNINDGTAAPATKGPDGVLRPSEDKWLGAMLKRDFTPKESFGVLQQLINKDWKTNLKLNPVDNTITFRGFYGKYEVIVRTGKKVTRTEMQLKKGQENRLEIAL